jgi:hypothetical protein
VALAVVVPPLVGVLNAEDNKRDYTATPLSAVGELAYLFGVVILRLYGWIAMAALAVAGCVGAYAWSTALDTAVLLRIIVVLLVVVIVQNARRSANGR